MDPMTGSCGIFILSKFYLSSKSLFCKVVAAFWISVNVNDYWCCSGSGLAISTLEWDRIFLGISIICGACMISGYWISTTVGCLTGRVFSFDFCFLSDLALHWAFFGWISGFSSFTIWATETIFYKGVAEVAWANLAARSK